MTQDQKGCATRFVYASHLAAIDLVGMTMKRVAAVDLNDDRGSNRFHFLEQPCRGRIVARGRTLAFQGTVELFRNVFSVKDLLLLEKVHRRRRLRWNWSTAALCST